MIKDIYSEVTLPTSKDVVVSFIASLNDEDFETAESFVNKDMQFNGVLGSREGAAAYFTDMKKMKLKYDLIKIFQDENDVCVLYNIDMSGKNIFSCGWYHLEDNKIKVIKVIFDPRPVLETAGKK